MQINRSTAPHRCQHGARTQQGQHRAAVIAKAAALRTVDKEFLNPIGVHALVYAGDWSEASARTVAAGAVAANFNLVEIAAFSAAKLDAAMTKSVLEEHGLQAACSLGLTLNSDVSSDQPDVSTCFSSVVCGAGFEHHSNAALVLTTDPGRLLTTALSCHTPHVHPTCTPHKLHHLRPACNKLILTCGIPAGGAARPGRAGRST
jgi:hypothetical protein